MRTLSHRDLDSALECIKEIHNLENAQATFDAFAARITALLHRMVPADLIGCLETCPDPNATAYYFDPPGVANEETHRVWEHVGHQHAVLSNYLRTGDSRFYKISDFLSQQGYRRLALYNELYRGMDVEDVLATFFPMGRSSLVSVALHRDRRTFAERDRLLLNLVQPHIVQAWKNSKLVNRFAGELADIRAGLEAVGIGMIVLDDERRIRAMNDKARSCLQHYFGDWRQAAALPQVVSEWLLQQIPARGRLPRPRVTLEMTSARGRLLITALPASSGSVLLAMQEQEAPQAAGLCALGLTAREAEIVGWVTKGKTNGEIATILGVSWRTIQKHMEHIFRKLGVDTRTAVATLAVENLRPQGSKGPIFTG